MLFNSYGFLFVFLPVVLTVYYLLGRGGTAAGDAAASCDVTPRIGAGGAAASGSTAAASGGDFKSGTRRTSVWLLFVSLVFYASWSLKYLVLLLGSIAVNYCLSGEILRRRRSGEPGGGRLLFLAVMINIGLLCYYKYLPSVLSIAGLCAALPFFGGEAGAIPLGISYFTITQLLYLVDSYEGSVRERDIVGYALFVSFFPHLLAGPILFHRQMTTQWTDETRPVVDWENLSRGFILLVIGLTKKLMIADELSPYVAGCFSHTATLTMFEAQLAAVSYALELYFDFSGYSDMAVGIARMMNIKIPINFSSPLRASSLTEFWQRWHISLTNAIYALVYHPLLSWMGDFSFRSMSLAAFATLFVIGIWHGAGWGFMAVALLNSVGIVVNQWWRHKKYPMPKLLGHIMTLSFVLVNAVFFRAATIGDGVNVITGMLGARGVAFPKSVVDLAAQAGLSLTAGNVPGALPRYVFLLALCLCAFAPASTDVAERLRPTLLNAVIVATLFSIISLFFLTQPSEFLYFQF